jgi:hypothetical protein
VFVSCSATINDPRNVMFIRRILSIRAMSDCVYLAYASYLRSECGSYTYMLWSRPYFNNFFQKIEVVTADGAPYGKKDFLVWDPPPIDPLEPSLGRQSSMYEAVTLMCYLMKRGIRTIL